MVTMSMGIGGAETHILELTKGLIARGIEVHVASAGGVFVEALQKIGAVHHTLPLDRREIFAMAKAKKGLETLIRKGNYDIVHAHARIPAFLCGKLRERMDFRFVTTDHLDFELTPLLRRLTNWGEWTFAVSEDLKRYLLENFKLNPRHISLTVNGVDTDYFSPEADGADLRASLGIDDEILILHISRLDAPVTVCASALIDAMPLIGKRACLMIVGDGDASQAMREKGNAINEKLGYPAIFFAGAQTDVRSYIAASDIVVAPSRAAMEGMACGKPTIISGSQGHGGIFSEAIADDAKKSNLCFRGSSLPTAERLASELLQILSMSREERKTLGALCRDFICRNYSVDIMVESQLSVYRRLAEYKAGGDPDVLVCGYYGYGNLGDETLLSVIVRELRKRNPKIRICVLSAKPRETAAYHMVDAVNRFDLGAVQQKMKKSKLFLFGGGSLLQDKTSNRSLSYYLHMLRLAKKNGLTIAIFANGIGPILREQNKKRVSDTLLLADHISLRDTASLDFCKKQCPSVSPRQAFDPAILIENENTSSEKEALFAVIPKRTEPDGAALLKKGIRYVMETHAVKPVFISLFDAEDREYTEKIARELGARSLAFSDAKACIEYLSHMRFLVSSRLHGLVYATSAGCPMLAFSDDIKLFSYMDTIGKGYDLPSCRIGDSEEHLYACLDSLLAHETEIRDKLLCGLPIWRMIASAEFDALLGMIDKK